MDSLVDVLMQRDGLTEEEALEVVADSRGRFFDALEDDFLSAFDWMEDEFGLEPDYLEDFLF